MRVDLDAKVRTSDGEAAGSVQRAIIDPRGNEVTDFVISTGGLFGHDVLVPRERLETATRDGDTISLDLTREQLQALPEYAPADYTVPATGWVPPVAYEYPIGSFLWPVGFDWASPQTTPAAGQPQPDEDLPPPMPDIDKGMPVHDRSGHEVGVVQDVRYDPASGKLQGLVIRAGGALATMFGGGDTLEISMAEVDRLTEGGIYLLLDKDSVRSHH